MSNLYSIQIRLSRTDATGIHSASKEMLDQLTAHHAVSANQVIKLALRAFHQTTFPKQYGKTRAPAGTAYALTLAESEAAMSAMLAKGLARPHQSEHEAEEISGGPGAGQSPI